MDEARYNLKLKRREGHIPIQPQMAGDEDFLATLGHSTSRIGQVSFTEHSDSGSESNIDVSDLINHSDKISSPVLASVGGAVSTEVQSSLDPRSRGNKNISQNDINHQILTQLANLGTDCTQSKLIKKTAHSEKSQTWIMQQLLKL